MNFKLFRILRIEYIIYIKNTKNMLQTLWSYPLRLFSGNIFDYDWILYRTSSSSIESNELFTSFFSHLICGWLVGASNGTGCSYKYKQQIVIQLHENHHTNTVYLKGTGRPIEKYTLPYSKLLSNTPSWKNDIPK